MKGSREEITCGYSRLPSGRLKSQPPDGRRLYPQAREEIVDRIFSVSRFVFKKLSEVEEGDFVDDFELPPIVPPPSDLDDAAETASTSSETSEPSAANTRTGAAARLLQIPCEWSFLVQWASPWSEFKLVLSCIRRRSPPSFL